jgi:predicted RNase H-like nuclease (RuvC/YqgF family)
MARHHAPVLDDQVPGKLARGAAHYLHCAQVGAQRQREEVMSYVKNETQARTIYRQERKIERLEALLKVKNERIMTLKAHKAKLAKMLYEMMGWAGFYFVNSPEKYTEIEFKEDCARAHNLLRDNLY